MGDYISKCSNVNFGNIHEIEWYLVITVPVHGLAPGTFFKQQMYLAAVSFFTSKSS